MRSHLNVAVFLLATGVLSSFLLVDAAVLRWKTHGQGTVVGAQWLETALCMFGWALLAVAIVAIVLRVDRRVAVRGAAIASGPIALGAWATFGLSPIIGDGTHRLRPYFDVIQLALLGIPVVVAVVFRLRGVSRERSVTGGAVGVLLVAMALVGVRTKASSPATYLRAIDTTVPILASRSFVVDGRAYEIETTDAPALPSWHAGEWRKESWSQDHGCFLRGPSGRMPLGNLWQSDTCTLGWPAFSERTDDPAIASAVYLDASRRYAILYQPEYTGPYMERAFEALDNHSAPRLCGGCSTYAMAIRVVDGKRIELGPRTIPWQLTVPTAMSAAAMLGTLLTLYFFIRSTRSGRRDDNLAALSLAIATAAPLVGAHLAGI